MEGPEMEGRDKTVSQIDVVFIVPSLPPPGGVT